AGAFGVLVRTPREADAVQAALRAHGLTSVTLVQASVFATAESRQLAQVLPALLDPTDSATVRTCLATDLFGLDAAALQAINNNPNAWATYLDRLLTYQRLWLDQCFLVMFQQLLADQGVIRRLTGRPGGERELTNYLHLAELLQDSPAAQHGAAALLRWFEQQRQHPNTNSADQLLRLENDEQLIRIVTIHRAKGLEFPVVFLPFLWSARTPRPDDQLLFHDPTSHRLILDLGTGREDYAKLHRTERLAEDLRLLYVAVTRARCCCLFCWGRVNGMEASGLARLLHDGMLPQTDAELTAGLKQLNADGLTLTLRPCTPSEGGARLAPPAIRISLQPLVFRGHIDTRWSMTSYSRLIADMPTEGEREDEPEDTTIPIAPEDFTDILTFPRGPAVGTCLHGLLERLDGLLPAAAQLDLIAESLMRAGIDARWQAATAAWLDGVLAVPLPGSCPLADLASRDRINELAFLFPLEQVSRQRLNTVLTEGGHRPLHLAKGRLQGLMKGFIDLVFRWQDRYYLADYKSNHLGPDIDHYRPESLAANMDQHHYHLQYLIYTLALHRHLQTRLPGYNYQTHFGGAYYLFLRAMHPDYPLGTGVFYARPNEQLVAALDSCCRGWETL
ncbi:MAG: 3'-5' exonuclease, partial [Desulfobulbus sp.]|nr:3'-5' exonuclease [Desulfobulbus sp.]